MKSSGYHSSSWLSVACAAVVLRNHFQLYQKDNSFDSKVKFRQASNCCKRVPEATKLAHAHKTKESITSQKSGSQDFWQIANSALNKGKFAIPPLFNGPEVLSSTSNKAKLFAEDFSKNSNLNDSGISLPVFSSRTNLKLHTISVTPKMVKKVIMNLDLSKASGLDCLPLVVLKNCVLELSYTLAELFNKCLKESCCVCALAHNALQLPFFFFFSFSRGFWADCLEIFSKCFIINYQGSV